MDAVRNIQFWMLMMVLSPFVAFILTGSFQAPVVVWLVSFMMLVITSVRNWNDLTSDTFEDWR